MLLLIIIYSILFAMLAWHNLKLALAVLIFALPSYLIRFHILFVPSTLLELMIWIVFLIWFIKSYQNKELSLFNKNLLKIPYPFGKEIILLIIISSLSLIVSTNKIAGLGILKAYFIEPVLFFIVFINVFKPKLISKQLKIDYQIIFISLAFSAIVLSVMAFYQKFTGNLIFNKFWQNAPTRRVTSFFPYPNAIGLYLEPIIIILLSWFFVLRNKSLKLYNIILQILSVIAVIMSILAIYYARSEGAMVAVSFSSFLFILLNLNKKYKIALSAIAIILFAIIISSAQWRPIFIKKITIDDFSGQIRRQQWKETWQMLKDNRLITGAGLDNYQKAIKPYHKIGIDINGKWQPVEIYLYPHNILLNFWSELGLAGMLLFIWIIGKFFYIGIKIFKKANSLENKYIILGLICAMLAIVIHGLVDVPYFKNDLSVMFWLLLAIMSLIDLKVNNSIYIKRSLFH